MGGQLVGGHSVTRSLQLTILINKLNKIHLLDIMGLENGTNDGLNPDDVKHLLEGQLEHGHNFVAADDSKTKGEREPVHLKNSIDNKAHCHVLVVSAQDIDTNSLPKSMLDKLTAVCLHSNNAGVPAILLLTKIEKVCERVAKDVTNVYSSERVYMVIQKAAEIFGIREMDIFPVQNYTKENDLKTPMNILLLLALRQMVRYSADFVENTTEIQKLKTSKD